MSPPSSPFGVLPPAPANAFQRSAPTGSTPLQLVTIGGIDVLPEASGQNEKVLKDCLKAILEAQLDDPANPDSWSAIVDDINKSLEASGPTGPNLDRIKQLYEWLAELNFQINHVLRETWDRCLEATDPSHQGSYSSVGGKFKDKFRMMLTEIKKDFPGLGSLVDSIADGYVNKEHIINKGGSVKGPQTEHCNLMYGGIPAAGSKGSLSELHKRLHRMKPGTGKTDYSVVEPNIQKVIEEVLAAYDPSAMGDFV